MSSGDGGLRLLEDFFLGRAAASASSPPSVVAASPSPAGADGAGCRFRGARFFLGADGSADADSPSAAGALRFLGARFLGPDAAVDGPSDGAGAGGATAVMVSGAGGGDGGAVGSLVDIVVEEVGCSTVACPSATLAFATVGSGFRVGVGVESSWSRVTSGVVLEDGVSLRGGGAVIFFETELGSATGSIGGCGGGVFRSSEG